MENIKTNQELLDLIRKSEVFIEFIKKDGAKRLMRCTLNFDFIPEKDYPKSEVKTTDTLEKMKTKKTLAVYDLDKQGWRSFSVDSLNWLKKGEIVYIPKIDLE